MQHTSIFINPLTDFGFKYLFGKESNKDFAILRQTEDEISEVTLVDKNRRRV